MTLLAIMLIGAIGTWVLTRINHSQQDFLVVCFSLLLLMAWNWTLLMRLPNIIRQDTILHLSPSNAALLVLMTLTLSLSCVYASVLKTRYLKRVFNRPKSKRLSLWFIFATGDILFTFIAFSLAIAAVPQLFYAYYRIIFSGLPAQWVIAPVSFTHSWHLLTINQAQALSTLSAGLLLSILLAAVCWSWLLQLAFEKQH